MARLDTIPNVRNYMHSDWINSFTLFVCRLCSQLFQLVRLPRNVTYSIVNNPASICSLHARHLKAVICRLSGLQLSGRPADSCAKSKPDSLHRPSNNRSRSSRGQRTVPGNSQRRQRWKERLPVEWQRQRRRRRWRDTRRRRRMKSIMAGMQSCYNCVIITVSVKRAMPRNA